MSIKFYNYTDKQDATAYVLFEEKSIQELAHAFGLKKEELVKGNIILELPNKDEINNFKSVELRNELNELAGKHINLTSPDPRDSKALNREPYLFIGHESEN